MHYTVGQKILKSPGQKKLMKSNKSVSWKFFLTNFHFLHFQKWPKINFWTTKNARNAFSRKKIFDVVVDFTSFFLHGFLKIFWPVVWLRLRDIVWLCCLRTKFYGFIKWNEWAVKWDRCWRGGQRNAQNIEQICMCSVLYLYG